MFALGTNFDDDDNDDDNVGIFGIDISEGMRLVQCTMSGGMIGRSSSEIIADPDERLIIFFIALFDSS